MTPLHVAAWDGRDMLTEEERKQGLWVDGRRLRFARAVKLYLGYQRAGGPLQSVQQDTENSVLEDLVNRYAQRSGPMIVPERPDHQLPTTP
jgi:hypothetical protein